MNLSSEKYTYVLIWYLHISIILMTYHTQYVSKMRMSQ